MNNNIIYPIVFTSKDKGDNSSLTVILPDGSRALVTENNIKAISQGLESGLLSGVAISTHQFAEDSYEHPIELVKIADNRNDFMAIVTSNELKGEDNAVCKYQSNVVTGTVIDPVPATYSGNDHYSMFSAIQNYNFNSPQMNFVKAAELPQQATNTDESKTASPSAEKERFNAAAAKRVMSKILFVQSNNAVYVFQGTYYKLCDAPRLHKLVRDTLLDETTRNGTSGYIKDIARFIQTDARTVDFRNANVENKVMFSNCVLNLDSLSTEQHSPYNYNTHALSVPFVSCTDSDTPVFNKYVYALANGNPILIHRIWETLGLLLSGDFKAKKIVVLDGAGNTGKSVFGNVVRLLIADENVTSFSPQKLTDRFVGTSLVNSAVNICMDLSSVPIDASTAAILKNLSGGDTVSGEVKYMNSFNYVYQGHLLYGTNYHLKLTCFDQAFADRLLIIPCKNPIPKHLMDMDLLEHIRPELPMVASRAVRAFALVRKNNYIFSGDDIYSVSAKDIYTKSSAGENTDIDTVKLFADQMCEVTGNDNDFVTSPELYKQYCIFCEKEGLTAISSSSVFMEKLHKMLPVMKRDKKRINGPTANIWRSIKLRIE